MFCAGPLHIFLGRPNIGNGRKNQHLSLDDLLRISHRMRSQFLLAYSKKNQSNRRLWRQVSYLYRPAFLPQLSLTLIASVTKFGPQYAMFNLLKLLEGRSQAAQIRNKALIWVSALARCMFFNALVESWLLWISWSQIAIPI